MCFSVKPNDGEYRIGYASSEDGIYWERDDHSLGLSFGGAGFDEKAVSYPNLFLHGNYVYMLYSGSYNGLGGFGIARSSLKNF